MTKIVFACKSNSCRSQMAEGWAKEWIQGRRTKINQAMQDFEGGRAVPRAVKGGWTDSSSLPRRLNGASDAVSMDHSGWLTLRRRLSLLENMDVVSVALDSSAVFKCHPAEECCGDLCETPLQRKSVKAKAVAAMAEDGVDISSYVPKTIEELVPVPAKPQPPAVLKGPNNDTMIEDLSAAYSSTLFLSDSLEKDNLAPKQKIFDKLVVLCSCGDATKQDLVRRSKSVEQWDIDPPTAAAKAGEGDNAYRRVSNEIRSEVNILMERLLMDEGRSIFKGMQSVDDMVDEKKHVRRQ